MLMLGGGSFGVVVGVTNLWIESLCSGKVLR